MARSSLVRFAATPDAVEEVAVTRLGACRVPGGALEITPPVHAQPAILVRIVLRPDRAATEATITASGSIDIPFFAWAFRPLVAIALRRERAHVAAALDAGLAGHRPPPPPAPVLGLPPVAFGPEQATFVATASAATAIAAFAGALFGQLSGPIRHSFGASDATIGVALAITRLGALFALFAIAIADRRGRRRSILVGVVGSAIACSLSAVAPNLFWFTTVQVFQRGLVGTTATVAFLAVVEEAPEGARAYAASMLALAGGFGFSFSVVALPLADLGTWGWRLVFALGAAVFLVAPAIARKLGETARYTALVERTDVVRGRASHVFERHGRRFVLLAVVAYLTSMFSAPSSQFMNQYLIDVHGYSNSAIAVFRAVTTGVPGLVGVVLGGRLAETRGRRPVAAIALSIATATQMVFFLSGGITIWFAAAVSIFTAGAGGIALGTLDAELFPTELRSTSNAMLYVVGVLGSATGLVLAGNLSDALGGLGRSVALTGVGSLLVTLLVVPLLPEPAAHALEEISPTETAAERGPDGRAHDRRGDDEPGAS